MKRIIVIAIATLGLLAAAGAQKAAPAQGHHARGAKLIQALGLTPDQVKSIRALRSTARKEIREIRAEKLDRSAMRAKVKAIRNETRAQIRTHLTPAQQAKLDAWRKSRKTDRQKIR